MHTHSDYFLCGPYFYLIFPRTCLFPGLTIQWVMMTTIVSYSGFEVEYESPGF